MVKRQIVEGLTRENRQKRRQELGALKDLVIKPSTVDRYTKAFKRFVEYLKEQRQTLSSSKEGLDSQIQEYVEWLREEGESISLAADTLSGVQHFQPSMKRHLPSSWRYYHTWTRYEIPSRAPPLTVTMLKILMGHLHKQSPQVALGLSTAFHGLLRTGELLSLCARDIVIPPRGHSAILYLGETKTGARNPHASTVTLQDPKTGFLLKTWKFSAVPTAPLIPWSPSHFRKSFSDSLHILGLSQFNLKPYSLRRGGATELWTCCRNFSQVAHAGRWAAEKTVKIYIQDSLALLNNLTFQPKPHHQALISYWEEVSCVEPRLKATKRGRGRR